MIAFSYQITIKTNWEKFEFLFIEKVHDRLDSKFYRMRL